MNNLRSLLLKIGFLPKNPSEPFYKPVLRALPTMLIVTAIMFVIDTLGWFKGFETAAIDSLLRAKSTPATSQVMIVTIDNEDYRDLFGGKSPIDPATLNDLLLAIAAGHPAVIGVDVDTTAAQFADRQWPAAVWARDADLAVEEDTEPSGRAGHQEAEDVVRLPILGGDMQEKLEDGQISTAPASGLIVFPQDFDGIVRRYRRDFPSVKADPPADIKGTIDTLPWAIVKQYAAFLQATGEGESAECQRIEKLQHHGSSHELVLNFAGDRYHFDHIAARQILAGSKTSYWEQNAPVKNMIVLVGGTYRTARDEYVTPVGRMYGVELIAQAIESDLRGGGIREVNRILAMVLECGMSVVLLYVNWRFPGRYTATLSLVSILGLSMLGSYLAFNAFAYWFNFTAVLLSTWIHALWEQSKERRELRHEVSTLRSKLKTQQVGFSG